MAQPHTFDRFLTGLHAAGPWPRLWLSGGHVTAGSNNIQHLHSVIVCLRQNREVVWKTSNEASGPVLRLLAFAGRQLLFKSLKP